jgi:hypothetical protein
MQCNPYCDLPSLYRGVTVIYTVFCYLACTSDFSKPIVRHHSIRRNPKRVVLKQISYAFTMLHLPVTSAFIYGTLIAENCNSKVNMTVHKRQAVLIGEVQNARLSSPTTI